MLATLSRSRTVARPTPSAPANARLARVGFTPPAVVAALRYFIGIGAFANSFKNPQLCSVWKACAVMSSTFPPSAKVRTPLLEPYAGQAGRPAAFGSPG